jgi:hypothetical protein
VANRLTQSLILPIIKIIWFNALEAIGPLRLQRLGAVKKSISIFYLSTGFILDLPSTVTESGFRSRHQTWLASKAHKYQHQYTYWKPILAVLPLSLLLLLISQLRLYRKHNNIFLFRCIAFPLISAWNVNLAVYLFLASDDTNSKMLFVIVFCALLSVHCRCVQHFYLLHPQSNHICNGATFYHIFTFQLWLWFSE